MEMQNIGNRTAEGRDSHNIYNFSLLMAVLTVFQDPFLVSSLFFFVVVVASLFAAAVVEAQTTSTIVWFVTQKA